MPPHGKRSEKTPEARKIRELERDLHRKDKALAEVSALLILKKKALRESGWVIEPGWVDSVASAG